MDESEASTRRRALAAGGAVLAGLAGCLGLGGSGGDGSNGGTTDGGDTTDGTTEDRETLGDDPGTTDATTTTTGAGGPIESRPLPSTGDDAVIGQVERFESAGAEHVEAGTDIDYPRMPPTSGPHYNGVVRPGFYEQPQSVGRLVHNLEHGAVVVYYDPGAITPSARESLRAFADEHTDVWAHVVVAPTPVEDPSTPYVLTAWRHRLDLAEYDPRAVRAFLAEYIGRGPENPVR